MVAFTPLYSNMAIFFFYTGLQVKLVSVLPLRTCDYFYIDNVTCM